MSAPEKCGPCQRFQERFRCNRPEECDCPKCQGFCDCEPEEDRCPES